MSVHLLCRLPYDGLPQSGRVGLYGDENISDSTVQLLHSLALLKWLNLQRVK